VLRCEAAMDLVYDFFMKSPSYILELQKANRQNPTPAEEVLWRVLRAGNLEGVRFLRQKAFGRYIVDFYCSSAKLVIELDGEIHDTPNAQTYDAIRTETLEAQGLQILRFRNEMILEQLPEVIKKIKEIIRPQPV
jgi:very-short-patch-repair endonuclease